jgi:hypothetical protein
LGATSHFANLEKPWTEAGANERSAPDASRWLDLLLGQEYKNEVNKSFRVFVGSTFDDLQSYRTAVFDSLHRIQTAVECMEYFGARPDAPKEECLRTVRNSQAYIGIFAMRYGSVDSESGKSFTHLEYEEARRVGLPSLIYLIDEERQPVLPKHVDFGEASEKLRLLKKELKTRHVVSFFTSPEDLALRVAQDLPPIAQRTGLEIRRGELAKLVESLPRIDWLTEERFTFFKNAIGELADQIPSDSVLGRRLNSYSPVIGSPRHF